jgi:hypothetical protein
MTRVTNALAVSLLLSMLGPVNPAMAGSKCDGDFENVGGNWIANRQCQREEAEKVAQLYHEHITYSPSSRDDVTPDQFCRGNNDIRVSAYCSSWEH